MSLEKIDEIIQMPRTERYEWQPAKRVYISKRNGKNARFRSDISFILPLFFSFPGVFGISMPLVGGQMTDLHLDLILPCFASVDQCYECSSACWVGLRSSAMRSGVRVIQRCP